MANETHKTTSMAGCSKAASGSSCDKDVGDEDHGDEGEEDWPENGNDDSALGDDVPAGGIDEDEWWNRPVGSGDEVEEWHAGDSDNDRGADAEADGEDAVAAEATVLALMGAAEDVTAGAMADVDANVDDEAEVDAIAEVDTDADADAAAVADANAEAGGVVAGRHAVFFIEEDSNVPWRITDDDVPVMKRNLRHCLRVPSKRPQVVLLDGDSPAEEPRPCISAADKGKTKVVDVPAKADGRHRTTKKKRKNDGDPGSSKGATKKQKKPAKGKDDMVVNEALGNDDDYAEAACPLFSFPEKAKSKDPTIRNADSHPPSPRSRGIKRTGRSWSVHEKLKWARCYQELRSLKKTSAESSPSIACIRCWSAQAASGMYKGAANCHKRMHGAGRHSHYLDMETALYRCICLQRANGNLRRPLRHVVLQWIAKAWEQVPTKVIIDAIRHYEISSKLDGAENHLVMSHLRARSTTDVSEDMCLGGTTGDNTRLLGQAPEEEEEEDEVEEMRAEGVREVGMATGLEMLYHETPNYRRVAAEANCMIEPRQTARHARRVLDLG
ncbi:unnamed protein product [Closterium sp. NIES-53]